MEVRRQRGDLIECYKILTGKENIDPHPFFHLSDNVHGLRGHSLKLSFIKSRLDLRKNFFSQRVTSAWNSLPQYHNMSSMHLRSTHSRTVLMPTGRPLVLWIWTIKAQPTEVHNITSTSTSLSQPGPRAPPTGGPRGLRRGHERSRQSLDVHSDIRLAVSKRPRASFALM